MSYLNESRIRAAKPKEKPYKLRDGRGLHLLVTPAGARLWRLRYRHAGRESMVSLGVYPDVSLKLARERRDETRKLIAVDVDPVAQRRAERAGHANTFEERGKHETAHRTKQRASQIFRYAIATGRAERDPTADLRGALAPIVVTNRAAVTDPRAVGALLRAIDGYVGQPSTEYALKLAPLVFTRPGELRAAEWSEIDLGAAEWRIPAAGMKMRELHLVPLARQAVELLRKLQPITGSGRYLFPSLRSPARPISENTLGAALRRLGFSKDEMTAHGLRAMASTLLNEQGFPPDVIELQLAHAERNEVRAAYNRAQRLAERRKMMQAWADYLDGLRAGANVVPLKRSA